MLSTTLSSKGQVVIPKELRDARQWQAGMNLIVEEVPQGLLIRSAKSGLCPRTTVDEVMGSLRSNGPALSLEEIDKRLQADIKKRWKKENP